MTREELLAQASWEKLYAWAKAKDPDERVGYTDRPNNCPLVTFFTEEVSPSDYWYVNGDTVTCGEETINTEETLLDAIVREVDTSTEKIRQPVTAAQFLAILEELKLR